MPNNFRKLNPGRLRSLLADHKTPILLLGAGASVTSGIPAAGETVMRAAKWAWCKENGRHFSDPTVRPSDYQPWIANQVWFDGSRDHADQYPVAIDNLLGIASDRREFFERLISPPIHPSSGYRSIAKILHQGWIHTVLTTNFDDCIHRAANLENQPHCIYKIKTREDLVMFSGSPSEPQLVYLHGSVEHYTDKNLASEVQTIDSQIVERVRPLLRDHPIIVVGYRGTEPSVMNGLFLEQVNYTNRFAQGVFWCTIQPEDQVTLSPLVEELASKIGTNFGSISIEGFDDLFDNQLWQRLSATRTPAIRRSALDSTAIASFDMQPLPSISLDSIDKILLKARLQQYSKKLRFWVGEAEGEVMEAAARLHLIAESEEGFVPTHGGILLFGKMPTQVLTSGRILVEISGPDRWLKTTLGDEIDLSNVDSEGNFTVVREIDGNLWNQLDELTEILSLVNYSFRLKEELSKDVQAYNSLALKEAIVNALVHRDYQIDDPIVVHISPKRVVITSPGGLIEEVTAETRGVSLETLVKSSHRGIKGYRNPVISDLFYGGGQMDRAGSGLSDLWHATINNNGEVTFGPDAENTCFTVEMFSRPEVVDEITNTAIARPQQIHRFAANIIPFHELPKKLWCASTDVTTMRGLSGRRNGGNLPPGYLHDRTFYSLFDLDALWSVRPQPFRKRDIFELTVQELLLQPNGRVVLVKLLNDALLEHFRTSGLWVDYYRKRVHFKKPDDSRELKVSYQARVRKATRTVVKERLKRSGEGVAYYEHKALSFQIMDFSTDWAILLSPGYTFTRDGYGLSIGRDRLNVLSTRRAAKDFNQAVHQDITFWISVVSNETNGVFPLTCREELVDFAPIILLSSRPPTVSYGADSFDGESQAWENDIGLAELEDEILSMIREEDSTSDGSEIRDGG